MRKILVTLDFKGKDSKLLEAAKEYGRAFGAEIILLNVDPIKVESEIIQDSPVMVHRANTIQALIDESVQFAEGKLGGDVYNFRHVLKAGVPHEMILEVAEKEKVDLIIVGNNKHSAAYRFLIGSVADQVIKKSEIPVLLIPND